MNSNEARFYWTPNTKLDSINMKDTSNFSVVNEFNRGSDIK